MSTVHLGCWRDCKFEGEIFFGQKLLGGRRSPFSPFLSPPSSPGSKNSCIESRVNRLPRDCFSQSDLLSTASYRCTLEIPCTSRVLVFTHGASEFSKVKIVIISSAEPRITGVIETSGFPKRSSKDRNRTRKTGCLKERNSTYLTGKELGRLDKSGSRN
ncbi:hypothetical protein SCHPADRAFT_315907 [Schizopora paradoxa]|uniref:Uncharacterized protein n=1 Tax=Schizopora paradoxa TaxID=27342 RepID=A0A0H2RR72_9AGAM|nr:hypothetical protein SCHPADRAFT_315907 [Schizopora paradoxa]